MATPETELHQEGPVIPGVEEAPAANAFMNLAADQEHMVEYDMLQQQIEDGKYDGDGPADVVPVEQ